MTRKVGADVDPDGTTAVARLSVFSDRVVSVSCDAWDALRCVVLSCDASMQVLCSAMKQVLSSAVMKVLLE